MQGDATLEIVEDTTMIHFNPNLDEWLAIRYR